jgi:hypothetical protein
MAKLFYTVINILASTLTVLKLDSTISPSDPALVDAELVGDVLVKSIFIGQFECYVGLIVDDGWDVLVVERSRTIDFDLNLSRDAA